MTRYDRVYATLAERAVSRGVIDVQALLAELVEAGVTRERIAELVAEDLDNDGPIFGQFARSLQGASVQSVLTATRQGEFVGSVAGLLEASPAELDAEQKALARAMREANVSGSVIEALDGADPEASDRVEKSLEPLLEFTWIAELVNTCHLCLPLHGKTQTMAAWREQGLHPDTIHKAFDGPNRKAAPCHCRMILARKTKLRQEAISPLKRVARQEGTKYARKTTRAVTQADVDASRIAADRATQTEQGRRVLRLLGQASGGD